MAQDDKRHDIPGSGEREVEWRNELSSSMERKLRALYFAFAILLLLALVGLVNLVSFVGRMLS